MESYGSENPPSWWDWKKQQKAKRIAAIVSIVSGFLIYMATTEMELGGYLQLMSEKENPVFMIAIFWAILIYSPIYRFIAERSGGVLMPDGTYRGADLDTFNPGVCFLYYWLRGRFLHCL